MTIAVRLTRTDGGKGEIAVIERRKGDKSSESAPVATLKEKGDEKTIYLHEGNEFLLREE